MSFNNSKKILVYAFIDSQNLNKGVQSQNWVLDFGKFSIFLRNKYHVKKIFLFIGYIKEYRYLYKDLQKYKYTLIFKNVLKYRKSNKKSYKGNVDAELVLHTLLEEKNYDKAIIISADGNFYCLIEHLNKIGKLYKIIVPNQRYSSLLRRYAKYIANIQNFRNQLVKERHSRGKQC